MTRDVKLIQRGVNVQANDMAVPPGTPLRAVNIDYQRDGVAQRRVGFESCYAGLPWYPIDPLAPIVSTTPTVETLPHVRGIFELWSKDRPMLIHGGVLFAFDESASRWDSVPVLMSHRFTFFGNNGTGTGFTFSGIGRAVHSSGSLSYGSITSPLDRQVASAFGDGFIGTIGNAAADFQFAGSGELARFAQPADVLYVGPSISDGLMIRRTSGALIAGSITSGTANGTGAAATFSGASWMATDGTNLYVADNTNQIRKVVVSTGVVTTFAGSTASGTTDAVGTAARFNGISGLTYDGSRFLYAVESAGARVRKCDVVTGSVTTIASTGFSSPTGIEYVGGDLYVGDKGNGVIKKVTTAGAVTTYAGTAALAYTQLVGGTFAASHFPNAIIRGQYLPFNGSTTFLVVESQSNADSTKLDVALVPVTASADEQSVYHIVRCPFGYPDGTTGPNKMDTWGPNVFGLASARGVDCGNGVVFSTSERPHAIDIWNKLNTSDPQPRLRPLGVYAPEAPLVSSVAGTTFAASTAVAYRTVCGLYLTDGRIALGPPSERIVLSGSTTATWAGSVTAFPSMGLPYDGMPFVQLYRTKTVASTLDPGDQMFLCYESALSYGNGVVFTDQLPDALLGSELYTNATADGIAYSSLPPPVFVNDVASFGDSAVVANTVQDASIRIKVLGVSSMVSGTSTITLTANAKWPFNEGTPFTTGGYTLTLNANSGATSGPLNRFQIASGGSAAQNAAQTARNIASCINRSPDAYLFKAQYDESDPGAVVITLCFPGRSKFTTSIEVTAVGTYNKTNTQASIAFSTNASTSVISIGGGTSIRQSNALNYSDQKAPDSFPVVYGLSVGPSTESIQRLLPISDTLLAVKDDSVWRMDANYVPQIYDTALSCNAPDSFARINNQWIGLFTRGFVALNSSQAVAIGRNIDRDVVATYDQLIGNFTTPFSSASSIDATGNYLCTVNQKTYCYNAIAQAWSEWQVNAVAQQYPGVGYDTSSQTSGMMAVGAFRDCFIASQDGSRSVSRQRDYSRSSSDWYKSFADFSYTLSGTISADLQTITATLVLVDNPGVYAPRIWSPPPGAVTDVNNAAAKFYWALDVTKDATLELAQGVLSQGNGDASQSITVTLARPLTTLTAGAVTSLVAYPPIICRVQYAPSVSPGSDAMFGDMLVTVERAQPGWLIARFFNRNDFGDATIPADGDYLDTYGVSRANLMPSITVSNSSGLGGLYNYHDPQRFFVPSERVSDQVLGVELWEGNAWQPFAIKSVSPDKRVKENVKVTR